jgi:hypothetical protein
VLSPAPGFLRIDSPRERSFTGKIWTFLRNLARKKLQACSSKAVAKYRAKPWISASWIRFSFTLGRSSLEAQSLPFPELEPRRQNRRHGSIAFGMSESDRIFVLSDTQPITLFLSNSF